MRQIFDVMFVLCLFLPPAAVLVGAVALAWPRPGHEVFRGWGLKARGWRLEVRVRG
jgi:hypothetical protein